MEKVKLSEEDFIEILLGYDLGEFKNFQIIKNGTVQTNYLIITNWGKFVLRFYNFREHESIKFEINLINYILKRNFPTAFPIKGNNNKYINFYKGNFYVFFEFVEGKNINKPSEKQFEDIIKVAALLNKITKNYRSKYRKYRWNYSPEFCENLSFKKSKEIGTHNAKNKFKWIKGKLNKLVLPSNLPRGICHCDFHYTNILFKGTELAALIDFDDANYTYLSYDLVSLVDPFKKTFNWQTWNNFNIKDEVFSFNKGIKTVKTYIKYRSLNTNERKHFFDILKFSILIDCLWYFERGKTEDFYEKRKIDALDRLGSKEFYNRLFG